MTTRSHSDSGAEALFEKQLEERKAIELKYSRLKRAVRAKCRAELKDLQKKEEMERWVLDPLEIPESFYWMPRN